MSLSMTGYGRGELVKDHNQVLVELKSLNGKNLEVVLKLAPILKAHETEIRNVLSKELLRGTVECRIEVKQAALPKPLTINMLLAVNIYNSAKELATAVGADTHNLLPTILTLPDVVTSLQENLDEHSWALVQEALRMAIEQLQQHRQIEGASLQHDLQERIEKIMAYQLEIVPLEPQRKQRIRERITGSIAEVLGKDKVDENRFEQELIYYIEKIDFTEEQMRLAEHCRYFLEILNNNDDLKGKRLGFILQEIGREINTLGSKANDVAIQKIVINMKDELEKAKEQVLNLL